MNTIENSDQIKKDIIRVLFANAIALVASVVNGFVLPKYLSISSYADIKTYSLYLSYAGIMHFGFIDGLYISYGGRNRDEIIQRDFDISKKVLFIFLLFVSIVLSTISIIVGEPILFLTCISIIPFNMSALYKMVFQALGEFDVYKNAITISSIVTVLFTIALLFLGKMESYWYIAVQIGVLFLTWIFCKTRFSTNHNVIINLKTTIRILARNTRMGIIFMIGNAMSILIVSLDRWFIKLLCTQNDFAYYSFAASMLKIFTVLITSFSITLYAYLCKDYSASSIIRVRRCTIIVGAGFISTSFVVRMITRMFLPSYIYSLQVIHLLFGAQLFILIVNSVFQNLFKALKLQKQYLVSMVVALITGAITNMLFYSCCTDKTKGIAIATVLTSFIWLLYNQISLKEYSLGAKEWAYIIIVLVGYFGLYWAFEGIGFVLYCIWFVILSFCFFRQEFINIINIRRIINAIGFR